MPASLPIPDFDPQFEEVSNDNSLSTLAARAAYDPRDLAGNEHLRYGDVEEAAKLFDASLATVDKKTVWLEERRVGKTFERFAEVTKHRSALVHSIAYLRRAVSHAPKGNEPRNDLAMALVRLGRIGRSEEHVREALTIFADTERELPEGPAKWRVTINRAVALFELGQLRQENVFYDESILCLNSIPNSFGPAEISDWARAQDHLANALMAKEEFAEATAAYTRALSATLPKLERARILTNALTADAAMNNLAEANEKARQALDLQPPDSAPLARARTLHNIGEANFKYALELISSEPERAIILLQSAEGYFEQARSLRRREWVPSLWAESTVALATTLETIARVGIATNSSINATSIFATAASLYIDAIYDIEENKWLIIRSRLSDIGLYIALHNQSNENFTDSDIRRLHILLLHITNKDVKSKNELVNDVISLLASSGLPQEAWVGVLSEATKRLPVIGITASPPAASQADSGSADKGALDNVAEVPHRDAVTTTKPVKPPLPELSARDIADIKQRGEERPWKSRPTYRMSPFEWVRDNFEEWAGKGLLQSHLKAADPLLYSAFTTRVNRDGGLPEWLDVPTEDEALLRRITDPEERKKLLAARALNRTRMQITRSIRLG